MNLSSALAIVGTLLLFIGMLLYSVPLALVVLGTLLLAAGLWSHHRNAVDSRPTVPERPDGSE